MNVNSYGSLYYATANYQDAVPAETCGEVPPKLKDEIRHRFVIASTYCRLKIHWKVCSFCEKDVKLNFLFPLCNMRDEQAV